MRSKFLSKSLNRKYNLGDLGAGERIILRWMLTKDGGKVWTGFIWLRIETSSGLL